MPLNVEHAHSSAPVYTSFVLTHGPIGVDVGAMLRAYSRLFQAAPRLRGGHCPDGTSIELHGSRGVPRTIVVPVPGPVPGGEAEAVADLSIGVLWHVSRPIPPHQGHIAITTVPGALDHLATLVHHTRVVAALSEATQAVGVYDGNAVATHEASFYIEMVTAYELPIMLWTGISIASESSGRLSLLTRGIQAQLSLPDILLTTPSAELDEALEFLINQLLYVVRRGEPIGEGETVGRTDEEQLTVHYVSSPVVPNARVMRVELLVSDRSADSRA